MSAASDAGVDSGKTVNVLFGCATTSLAIHTALDVREPILHVGHVDLQLGDVDFQDSDVDLQDSDVGSDAVDFGIEPIQFRVVGL